MIKLNAGFSRKVGEANYGSRGASVNLELELESSVVSDADKMHERIRSLFALAKKAVDEELRNGNGAKPETTTPAAVKPEVSNPKGPVCSECGTDDMSEKVVKFSTDKFGKPLCYKCQRKAGGKEGGRT